MENLTTKQLLAKSLKKCMETKPFSKISVSMIAEGCHLNRKSFYYHFQDKYDLLTWIFDSEVEQFVSKKGYVSGWEKTKDLYVYLDANRKFYKKAFRVEGQNSLQNHFYTVLKPAVEKKLKSENKDADEFTVQFFLDAIFCTSMSWLKDSKGLTPFEFVSRIEKCLNASSERKNWVPVYDTKTNIACI